MKKVVINLLLTFLLCISFVNADSNGIWTNAEDIKSGTFSSDEGNGDFTFPEKLKINNDLITEKSIIINGGKNVLKLNPQLTKENFISFYREKDNENKKYYIGIANKNNEDFIIGHFGMIGKIDLQSNVRVQNDLEIGGKISGNGIYLKNVNADLLDNLDSTAFQKRITSDCGANKYVYGINEDGSLDCRYDIDTKKTDQEIKDIISSVGYLTTEVDGSITNELQDLNSVLLKGSNAGNKKITSVANPTSAQDAATKSYVDSKITSLPNCNIGEVLTKTSSGWGCSAKGYAFIPLSDSYSKRIIISGTNAIDSEIDVSSQVPENAKMIMLEARLDRTNYISQPNHRDDSYGLVVFRRMDNERVGVLYSGSPKVMRDYTVTYSSGTYDKTSSWSWTTETQVLIPITNGKFKIGFGSGVGSPKDWLDELDLRVTGYFY